MEALRTVKETAEQPEKEAKERHLKAWEGKFWIQSTSTSTVYAEYDFTICTVVSCYISELDRRAALLHALVEFKNFTLVKSYDLNFELCHNML